MIAGARAVPAFLSRGGSVVLNSHLYSSQLAVAPVPRAGRAMEHIQTPGPPVNRECSAASEW
jgi:hypothetical protein